MTSLGGIRGQIRIDARQAIASYASVRRANETTRVALAGAASSFIKVGAVALAAAAPIALLFKKSVMAAADFQKKIDYFGAVTNATKADMQAVADKAMEMSRTTVYSAADMADAFVEFGKAGISTRDILDGVAEATTNLAQAADISVGEAANTMAANMATFNIKAKDASHIADELAGAANASIIDVQDLAYSLKYAGGIAASTGISFDSVVTAISLLGQRGIKGSTAGTSLRQIMVSLTGATSAARTQMKELGIITKDGTNKFITQSGHIKSLSQVFQVLQDAEKGYTQAQQLQINKTIFNSRALSAVQILMRDGAKGFRNMNAEIGKVKAADVAHKRLDNLSGDMTHLKNSIQTMLIQVGGPLQQFMRSVVKGLTGLVQWFGNLSPHMQKVIIYGLGIVGIFLVVFGTLSLVMGLLIKAVLVWRDFKLALIAIRVFIMESLIPSFIAMGAALMANPVVLITLAIIALAGAFIYCWKHFAGFRNFFKQAWADIKQWSMDAWNIMKGIFNGIVAAAKWVGAAFMKYLVNPVRTAISAVISAFHTAYTFIAGVITTIVNFVKEHWKAIIAVVLGPLGLIIDAITTHWAWIVRTTKAAFNLISSVISTVWGAIYRYTSFIIGGIIGIIRGAWNIVSTVTRAVFNGIVAFFTMIWSTTINIFQSAGRLIARILSAIWSVIGGPLKAFWNGISRFFSALWSGIANIFSTIWDGISRALSAAFDAIWKVLSTLGTYIYNGVVGALGKLWDVLSNVVGQVLGFFGHLYDDMLTVGENIIKGIWNGIMGLAGWLWDHVKGWLSDLWNGILGFFGIHSPSTRGRDAGRDIVLGISQGIEDTIPRAKKSMMHMADVIAGELKDARGKLIDAKNAYLGNIRNISDSIIGSQSISGMGEVTDPKTSKTSVHLDALISQYGNAANKVREFRRDLQVLRRRGLSKYLVDQLVNAGIDALPQVRQLVKATKDQIGTINNDFNTIGVNANQIGGLDSRLMYKSGVDAAQAVVDGLKSKEKALVAVASTFGKKFLKEIKKELGIRSPARSMSHDVMPKLIDGIVLGIDLHQHRAVGAIRGLSKSMVAAMRASDLDSSLGMSGLIAASAATRGRAYANRSSDKMSGGGFVVNGGINNHYPKPETASDSLPRTIRQMNYMTSGPVR